jgi:DNA replication and repair protein RecF
MYLNRVEIGHFRNLTSVSLSPAVGLNILEGENASGKTSFLEAIYMLGLARSFRTIKTKQLVQDGFEDLLLFATFTDSTTSHRLGLQRFTDNRMTIRLDGETLTNRTRLVDLLPLQLITPESISLLLGAPAERRSYLDWILFHVEPLFYETWKRYQRAIKQRNALLRDNRLGELPFWNRGVVEHGNQLAELRRKAVDAITPHIEHYVGLLLAGQEISLSYRQGWRSGESLESSLERAVEIDIKQKYTGVGPHRAELVLSVGDKKVTDSFSRGQLKLLLCALKLAQLEYIKQQTGKNAVVLVDDLPAELDANHRALLLRLLHDLETQVFVTTTDRSHLDVSLWDDVRVFHVEHGNIKEVV